MMLETIGVDIFKQMQMGEGRTYRLADKRKVKSVRVAASGMKDYDMDFTVRKVPNSERKIRGRKSIEVTIIRNK